MSSQIFYERVYIRLPRNLYIPLFLSGPNNTYDSCGPHAKRVRYWYVYRPQSAKKSGTYFLSQNQIKELAEEARGWPYFGMYRKSISSSCEFTPESAEKYVLNGLKKAFTIEEYHNMGNRLIFSLHRDATVSIPECVITTTEQLLSIYDKYEPSSIRLEYSTTEPFKWPTQHSISKKKAFSHGYGYVIGINNSFLRLAVKQPAGGFRIFLGPLEKEKTQVFTTKRELKKYIKEYCLNYEFKVSKVLLPSMAIVPEDVAA